MIRKLDQRKIETSRNIRSVFQWSYAIEAEILKAVDFPPLNRTLEEFLYSQNQFYGFWKNEDLAGVVEINNDNNVTHIQSLVVAPTYFRQGLAQQLVAFVLDHFESEKFMVETGLANEPALKLYRKFGFEEIEQWDTDHGIRKIRFELRP